MQQYFSPALNLTLVTGLAQITSDFLVAKSSRHFSVPTLFNRFAPGSLLSLPGFLSPPSPIILDSVSFMESSSSTRQSLSVD